MPTIAKNNDVITVIFSFAVEPERQQELINMMIDALETTTKHQPGFVLQVSIKVWMVYKCLIMPIQTWSTSLKIDMRILWQSTT
jgi:hypothetical protein